jgi:hypothetical protein
MNKKQLLNILRNPYNWDEESRRKARLFAADIIDNMIDDTFYFELKPNIEGLKRDLNDLKNKP